MSGFVHFEIRFYGHFVYSKEVMPGEDSTIERPLAPNTTFNQAVEIYRTNYTNYRATGNPSYKIAYENAEKWIQLYLQEKQKQVSETATDINGFVQEYATANPELATLKNQFQTIRTVGPKLEDQYIQTKRINEEVPQEDMTSYYVKAAIVVGLFGIAAAVSAF
jgi:hypothetical protein